jgi:hypothetical protein
MDPGASGPLGLGGKADSAAIVDGSPKVYVTKRTVTTSASACVELHDAPGSRYDLTGCR